MKVAVFKKNGPISNFLFNYNKRLYDLFVKISLEENYNYVKLSNFNSKYIDMKTYSNIRNNALKTMSLFGST